MKRIFAGLLGCCVMVCFSAQAFAWEFDVDESLGAVQYEEDDNHAGSTIKTDWNAFYSKTTFGLSDYDNEGVEGDMHCGVSFTSKDRETWVLDSVTDQTNDMSFWGIDTGIDIGWAFPIDGVSDFSSEKLQLAITPMIGYRWKFIRFTRSSYTIGNDITIAETDDEDFNVHCLDLGGRFSLRLNENWEIFTKPLIGIVVYNSVENSGLGKLDGDGGTVFDMDTGINYAVTEDLSLGVLFTTEIQHLVGGTKNNIIWPDNTTEVYGGKIRVVYKFG